MCDIRTTTPPMVRETLNNAFVSHPPYANHENLLSLASNLVNQGRNYIQTFSPPLAVL